MTKVFISYSHDSNEHRDFVRGVADRLCQEGVDCLIDRYINGFPPEGWPRWMENQVEVADYVLLVCTETYLRRYRGQETEGGRGVNFEGVVISQTLYDHYYKNSKFIPVIPDDGDFDHVPLPLKPYSTYRLNSQYDDVYQILTGQAEYVKPELGDVRLLPVARTIFSDDLPTVEGELFGRKDELALLDRAFTGKSPQPLPPQGREGAKAHIVQFVASGGTGKTKLIRHWLDENNEKIDALIAWSFYSQGSSEDKQISATPFFMQALKSLGSDKSVSDFNTEEEKGEYVANLLREKRCLLVLDGLEPLQQVGRGMRGELKDRAIRKMLRCLVGDHSSLCIITTRLPVHELKGRRQVVQHDLQNLAPEDGVDLLRSFGVSGRDADMLAAVEEYGRHALALHLLGNALATYLDGDVRKRDTLTELIGDYDDVERHAFKVMQAYERWLAGTPELKLLYLLGLFDHPVEQDVLEVLWGAEIPGLTAPKPLKWYTRLSSKAHQNEKYDHDLWKIAQKNLISKYQIMSQHEDRKELFDCHPLIREYFGRKLKKNKRKIWQQAHRVLYEYYKGLPEQIWGKYLPDTLEEMQPLFRAVTHGCLAGLQKQVKTEVYWLRISQERNFLCYFLHSYNNDISILASFFSTPWEVGMINLPKKEQPILFNWAGNSLMKAGRIKEASMLFNQSAIAFKYHQDHYNFILNLRLFSGTKIILGEIRDSLDINEEIEGYIKSKYCFIDERESIACKMVFLKTLHDYGAFDEALEVSMECNKIGCQLKEIPSYWYIYYLELLLSLNREDEVIRVFNWIEERVSDSDSYQLAKMRSIAGLAYLRENKFLESLQYLEISLNTLRHVGLLDSFPTELISYAILKRTTSQFNVANDSLREVYEIAEPSGMRLYLTDYHLEMARLILAVEADPIQYLEATPDREQRILPFADQEEPGILTLQEHIAEADRLINETGYHRRDAELAELKQQAGMS